MTVDGATSYGIEMQLPSGDIISGAIADGKYIVDSSALTEVGQVRCQVTASAANAIIKKSDIFTLAVLPNLNSAEPLNHTGFRVTKTTAEEYEAMPAHSANTIYLVINDKKLALYLGDIPLSAGGGVSAGVAALYAVGAVGFAGVAERIED